MKAIALVGLRPPASEEARRRIAIFNAMTLVGIVTALGMGALAFADRNQFLGVCDMVLAIALVVTFVWHLRTGDFRRAAAFGVSFVGAFFSVLFLTGGEEATGHVWFYTFPLISAFLLGARFGLFSSLTLLLATTALYGVGLSRADWIQPYSIAFIVRFIPSYLLVLAYSYFFEKFRQEAHTGMEKRVQERTADVRESHERFVTVLDGIDANVYVSDMETHELLFINRRMLETFGEECVGKKCFELIRGRKGPCENCTNPLLLDEQGEPTGVIAWENRNEVTGRWFLYHDRAIRWVDGRLARLQVATDLTKRKEAEEENHRLQTQLLQAQKMEAIGTLAGGVAHDLNNILSAIVGYPDLILQGLPEDTKLKAPLTAIRDSGERAARIVHDLLTLARRGITNHRTIHLGGVVESYLGSPEFLAKQVEHPEIEVVPRLANDLPSIEGSETQVFKALMNLVTNAFEAISDGGRIVVLTEYRRLHSPLQGYTLIPAGEYAVLSVADTGEGISANDLPRIFEPFFSKKKLGRSGTGLGMAVVWGTVLDHEGYVDVQSMPGRGSQFSLYFPLSANPDAYPPPAPFELTPEGTAERILLVDDDEHQRDLGTAMLQRLGYQARAVSCGEDAVALLAEQPFDLVLLDMIMEPGIDGFETYRRILSHRPGQKAIITSGFAQTERVAEAQRLGAGAFLRKPFRLRDLAEAVRTEMNRNREAQTPI